jgi:hypothetical protein
MTVSEADIDHDVAKTHHKFAHLSSDDAGRPEANWRDLLNQMDVLKPALVIIDGRNGVLVGDDRGAVRWFGTLAYTLARLRDCAVLLLVDGDADRWNGCADFKFAFSGSADGETMRAALAAAIAEGALPSMPR